MKKENSPTFCGYSLIYNGQSASLFFWSYLPEVLQYPWLSLFPQYLLTSLYQPICLSLSSCQLQWWACGADCRGKEKGCDSESRQG